MLCAGENGEFGFGIPVADFSCKRTLGPAVNSERGYRKKREIKIRVERGDSPAVSVPAAPPPAMRIVEASGRDSCICLKAAIDSS